jgi:hypothetical protein
MMILWLKLKMGATNYLQAAGEKIIMQLFSFSQS